MVEFLIFHICQHKYDTGFVARFKGNGKQAVPVVYLHPFPFQQHSLPPEFIQHVQVICSP